MIALPETSKRSWPWGVKFLIVLVSLVLVAGGVVYLLGRASNARWLRYAEKLRADGSPLTFDGIEAKRTIIPDDQNSALIINRLVGGYTRARRGFIHRRYRDVRENDRRRFRISIFGTRTN